jgi:hypothetical protein
MKRLTPSILLPLLAAVLIVGCLPSRTATMPDATSVLTETSDKITAAMEHNRVIAQKIEDEPKSPVAEVKPVVRMQADALAGAKLAEREAAMNFAERETKLTGERDAWKGKYDALRSDPFVRAALWVKWALIAITVAYVVAGIAGMLLTALCGGGLWFNLGRNLLAFLPFSNLFSFGSRFIEGKWGATQ